MGWWKLVRVYSGSDITYAGDKLIALAGLAKTFGHLIMEDYYAGIWGRPGLLRSLLWREDMDEHRRRPPITMEYRGAFLRLS
jgi:hypothetical protein